MSFRPVPSLSIMIGEPHRLQKRRFIGSPLCPPGIVKVVIGPVTTTLSARNAMPETKAVPVCFWQSTQWQRNWRSGIGSPSMEYLTAPHRQPPVMRGQGERSAHVGDLGRSVPDRPTSIRAKRSPHYESSSPRPELAWPLLCHENTYKEVKPSHTTDRSRR